ncbi:MAG: thermonuclease family protein [Acidobacteriota bacterium]|nr:thermonuclease family protein [Acidobacteriota bacterium]
MKNLNNLIYVTIFVLIVALGCKQTDVGKEAAPQYTFASNTNTEYASTLEPAAAAKVFEGKVIAVSDGDTITVLDTNNKQHKIRFAGIDAPEAKQDFGNKAKENLSALLFNKTVRVISNKTDKYGRTVGTVLLDSKDINLEQIKAGFAWHYKEYAGEQSETERKNYADAEVIARRAKIGLWSMANPTAPWAFRKGANVNPADADKIFGNKNSLIYHWAGCPGFTKIGEKNRVVFATPTIAEAAGYRAAKNCASPIPKPSSEIEHLEDPDSVEESVETESEKALTYTVPAPSVVPPPIVVRQPTPETYTPKTYPTPAPTDTRETTAASPTATAICADGTLSYSANRRGTCSHHGGVSQWLDGSSTRTEPTTTYSPPRSSPSDTSDRPKTVQVDGYYRKDGTYVRPHTRSAPRRKN